MSNRIGINIASLLPWSAVPLVSLRLSAWITRKAGYTFWQVLPLRGVSAKGLKETGIPVLFIEGAWNPTTFWAHLRGRKGAAGNPTLLQDPLFFPPPQVCQRVFGEILEATGAQPVYHHIEDFRGDIREGCGGLLEVHPGCGIEVDRLLSQVSELGERPLVLDTRHLRRGEGEARLPFAEALRLLRELVPHTALVHVQAWDSLEWQKFLVGGYTQLRVMIETLVREGYLGPFVVEFDPRALGPGGLLPWVLASNLNLVWQRLFDLL